MGLTIHYSLQSDARSAKEARELVARLRGRALDLPFERVEDLVELDGSACNFRQHPQEHPSRWLLIQAAKYLNDPHRAGHSYNIAPTHVIAFSTWPGQGCEQANFGLCHYPATIEVRESLPTGRSRKIHTGLAAWSWASFCKTQYASDPNCGGVENFLRCHLSVVRMLDHAKELGILQSVSDEGDFWQQRDIETLARNVGQWNESLAALAGQLKDRLGDDVLAAIVRFPNFEHLEAAGRAKE
jgi:hypothetical protein